MTSHPIAITGLSVLFPGSTDSSGFWRDVAAGRDLLTDVPPTYWASADYFDPDPKAPDRAYTRRGGFIPQVPFDPLANGIPPSVLPATDNAQLLGLIVAERALHDAIGKDRFPKVDRKRVSVILGATGTTELIGHMSGRIERPRWEAALRAGGFDEERVKEIADCISNQFAPWQENTFPGFLGNVIAGRIANRLDLGGTNCVVDAACASSLAAIRMAVQELTTGDSELVLTGGVDALNVPLMYLAFSKTGALSRTGNCRPYSDQADGTILADGVGIMALRRLADAERDGDKIYAVIRGMGSSSDGRAKSIYAPVAEGQARAIRQAYEAAGFSPSTVELVEGHGTGTIAGDKAEVAGLSLAFDADSARREGEPHRRQWCALGSVKSQIGHAKGAAGVAGLFKAVMALHHKVLPPTIKVDRPNPAFEIAKTPFYLNTRLRPWVRDGQHPRRAGVSSAGFGGTNFHVVLEEYVGPGAKPVKIRPASTELILIAAENAPGLVAACEQVLRECDNCGDGVDGLQRIARRTQERFGGEAARIAVVASDLGDLKQKLGRAADTIRKHPDRELNDPSGTYYAVGKQPGEVAFLFPGQGSQYVGMGQDLALYFDEARAVWDRSAELELESGVRLHDVVFPRPAFGKEEETEQEMRLTRTEWAQPALAACSMAAEAVLRRLGLRPAFVAGHSFGELSALCSAGAFELRDLIRAARRRGELMATASDVSGTMTAVRASTQQVEQTLGQRHPQVLIANRNSPRQVVLSGPTAAVAAAETDLAAASITFKRLPVSTAFHSPLVSSSVEPFRAFLQSTPMQPPKAVVLSTTTTDPYPTDCDQVKNLLSCQLANPVRFEEVIQRLVERGVRTFVEIGPRGVLTGLVSECLQEQPHLAVAIDRKNQSGLTSLWHCLGQLAVQGVTLNRSALWQHHADLPVPNAPPAHAVMVGGSSKGRAAEVAPCATNAPRAPVARQSQTARSAVPGDVSTPPPVGSDQLKLGKPALFPATTDSVNGTTTQRPPHRVTQREGTAHVIPRAPAIPFAESAEIPAARADSRKGTSTIVAPTPESQNLRLPRQHARSESTSASHPSPTPQAMQTDSHTRTATTPSGSVKAEPPPARMPNGLSTVVREILGEAARVQESYQNLMAASSQRFLESVERTIQQITGSKGQVPVDRSSQRNARTEEPFASAIVPPPPTNTPENRSARGELPRQPEVVVATPAAQKQPVMASVPVVTGSPASAGCVDVERVLLSVVSEKTGYPPDLLGWDMDMESDLGIDSIKRVEILSALELATPGMAGTDPSRMFALRTLADVRELLRNATGAAAPQPSVPATTQVPAAPKQPVMAPVPVVTGSPASAGCVDVERVLLSVVSEKTGYPPDLLGWDMDMESDLGIDSIKRVEILSALELATPGMAGTDPSRMFALRTLADVRELLRNATGAAAPQPSAPASKAVMPSEPPASVAGSRFPRRVAQVVNAPAVGFAMAGLREASPLVIVATRRADGENVAKLASALAERFEAYGLDATVAQEVPDDARGVIFLGGLRSIDGAEQGRQVLQQAILVARAFSARGQAGGIFVTVQDTGGDFGFSGCGSRAWVGGLPGLVKTAAIEWPKAAVKAIDLEQSNRSPDQLAEALLTELLTGAGEVEVGLRADGRRVTVACVPSPLPSEVRTPVLADGDVVVVSGGARGVTTAALKGLTQFSKPRFVLLGRTSLQPEPACCHGAKTEGELVQALVREARSVDQTPTPAELRMRAHQILHQREIKDNVAALRSAGAEVRYVTVDVRDSAALAKHLVDVRREWGPIRGVIHGAGVVADRLIKDKTPEQIEQVFSVKIDGLRSLLEATASDNLRLLCLFSSVAGRFGNQGQSDYSMANEVLNKVADAERHRRGAGCLVKSINWGAWEGGMVTPSLKDHFEARGVRLLPLEEGGRQFAAELMSGSDGVEVILGVADVTDPLQAGRSPTTSFEVAVLSELQGYLCSHCVEDDVPVLPVVQVLEWFVRAGSTIWPGHDVCCRDLKVLSGVQLRDFDRCTWFQIVGRRTTEHVVEVELRRGDMRHYSATLEMVAAPSQTGFVAGIQNEADRALSRFPAQQAYDDGKLFHGPQFQVLRSLSDLSDVQGCRAELTGTIDVSWGGGPWLTDPAALDGGLQLALLWILEHKHLKSLPTRFEAYVPAGGQAGPVRCCDLRMQHAGRHEVVLDLCFSDAQGRPVSELRGVTMTLLHGSKVKVRP